MELGVVFDLLLDWLWLLLLHLLLHQKLLRVLDHLLEHCFRHLAPLDLGFVFTDVLFQVFRVVLTRVVGFDDSTFDLFHLFDFSLDGHLRVFNVAHHLVDTVVL